MNTHRYIKFSGSKNGQIIALRWIGPSFPYPGMGRWCRMNLDAARVEIATGEAEQYITGQLAESIQRLKAFDGF